MSPAFRDSSLIRNWHACSYFDAGSREEAMQLSKATATQLAGKPEMGRFHEKPVGSQSKWGYEMAIETAGFTEVIDWRTWNLRTLDLIVQLNTDDSLRDQRDAALWVGTVHELILSVIDDDVTERDSHG